MTDRLVESVERRLAHEEKPIPRFARNESSFSAHIAHRSLMSPGAPIGRLAVPGKSKKSQPLRMTVVGGGVSAYVFARLYVEILRASWSDALRMTCGGAGHFTRTRSQLRAGRESQETAGPSAALPSRLRVNGMTPAMTAAVDSGDDSAAMRAAAMKLPRCERQRLKRGCGRSRSIVDRGLVNAGYSFRMFRRCLGSLFSVRPAPSPAQNISSKPTANACWWIAACSRAARNCASATGQPLAGKIPPPSIGWCSRTPTSTTPAICRAWCATASAAPSFANAATQELCALLLPDSAHLMEEDADARRRVHGYSRHNPPLPLYT